MPGAKEIRSKIASVKSTQKITKAMQMVATSKMRRAQERMKLARPYAQKMRNVIGHLTEANPDYRHPFLVTREPKAVGIIVISTDRGLAGALNANVFKQALLLMRDIEAQVYRAAGENVASEMAARMVAMKAASDNAGKLITELQLIYNKARQAAITKELSEIVGGAAAV